MEKEFELQDLFLIVSWLQKEDFLAAAAL